MERKKKFFQQKHSIVERVLSFMLAFAMVLTMGSFTQLGKIVAEAGNDTTNLLKVHFKNEMNWDSVNAKYGSGGSWTPIAGYEDAKNNEFGVAINQDAVNEGWYTYTVKLPKSVTEVQGLFNTGAWDADKKTANYSIKEISDDTEVWITYGDVASSNAVTVSREKPEGWLNTLRVHYNNTANWDTVYTKFGAGSTWDAIAGYEDYKNAEGGYGKEIAANADNEGWYTYVIGLSDSVSQVCGLYNSHAWGGNYQTSNYSVSVSGDTEAWITDSDFSDSNAITVSYEKPNDWVGDVLVAITNGDVPEEYTGPAKITVHFDNGAAWNEVAVYLTNGNWKPISGYSYTATWPGAEVEADTENRGWYSFTINIEAQPINVKFNNNNQGKETGTIEITPKAATTEMWVTYDGKKTTSTSTAPAGWINSTSNPPVNPNADSTIVSPVVNADNTVTVNLDATGTYADAEDIRLMGTLKGSDWSTGLAMTKDTKKGVWTITTPAQTAGVYGYKFRIPKEGGNVWFTDPSNESFTSDGNSKVVISGLESKVFDAKRGEATALPKLNYYDAQGNATSVTPQYSLKDTSLANIVTIADDKITVKAGSTVEQVVLIASAKGTTSEVTVNIKDFVCNYTVYYYDYNEEHRTETAADVHVWEVGGTDIGDFAFRDVVTLEDDNQWLKATFTSSASKIGLIPRSAGAWNWQTGNHYYENTAKNENVTLYIVYGDDANTYTELPEIREVRDRCAIIEYERSDADYTGWNIYTWNSGFGNKVSKPVVANNGKYDAIIPVYDVTADFTLGFCMRKSEGANEWAQKDGGDHNLVIPADQLVVKAKFVQDEGIVEVLPYNIGYEMDAANDRIHFYYRDDELFKQNKEASLNGKVQVVIDGQAYAMAYDAANERYYYDAKSITNGDHEYYYVVNGENVIDAFNDRTNADETASVLTYKKFDNLGISATMYYPTMTYNDNNVVMVKLTGDDAANLTREEIASVKVDCFALGTGILDIEPQLMEGTIACVNTVKAGDKTLPVTLKDIYGNVCETTVDVTVKDRTATDSDFDWDESVIYFTVTDRFFDGNTANNDGVHKDGSLSYHGGDFAGLEAKLDYLQDLGINTIWITPIVENSDTVTDKEGEEIESTGYHGYWASDFTKLNSHLGTEEEFAALINAVHARGMKLMVDVVVNHAGYNTEPYFNSILVDDTTGESIAMIRDASNSVTGSDVYGSLAGLPDFVTENEDVRNQLIEWQVDWITKYDIDYFRVDTVKHVDTTTWKAFKNALTKQNQDFKMIGEEAGSGYATNSVNLGTGSMDALLDFDTNGWMVDFLTGNISSIEASMVKRNGSINNTKTLGQFLNSHDEDGLQYTLQDEKHLTEQQAADLMKVAATMTLTAKGIPVIYYGEELGLYGKNNYPYQTNRYDMDWTLAAQQQADSTSIYNHYKTMLNIRKEYSTVFARGDRKVVVSSDEEGYDVISRTYNGKTLYIGMNIKDAAKEVTIPVSGEAGSVYTNLYDGKEYTVSADQKVTISIPAAKNGGTIVLAEKVAEDDSFLRYIEVSSDDYSEVINSVTKATDGTITVVLPADSKKIPAEIFNKAAGKDITLVFVVADSASWTVSAKTITSTIAAAIDLNVTLNTSNIPADIVSALAGNNKTMQLSLAHDGAFGFDGSLTLSVGDTYKGKYANLYYYNPTTKGLEYQQAAKVTEDGKVTYGFKHASEYVIVFADTDLKPADPKPADPSTPTAPTTPTTPTTPTAPTTPATPADTTAKETPTVEAPKTGDETPVAGFAVALMASGLALALLLRKKTKRSK